MSLIVDTQGIAELRAWVGGLKSTLLNASADEVEAASETLANNVESVMPVDTGWAQSRWGEPNVAGGVWERSDDGLSIRQGSDLRGQLWLYEYIIKLNEGSSKQAPAGFIDVEAHRAGDDLEKRINDIARGVV